VVPKGQTPRQKGVQSLARPTERPMRVNSAATALVIVNVGWNTAACGQATGWWHLAGLSLPRRPCFSTPTVGLTWTRGCLPEVLLYACKKKCKP